MNEEMKQELSELKERDKCEDCTWLNIRSQCEYCRLDPGNSYFMPNLFYRKKKGNQ